MISKCCPDHFVQTLQWLYVLNQNNVTSVMYNHPTAAAAKSMTGSVHISVRMLKCVF